MQTKNTNAPARFEANTFTVVSNANNVDAKVKSALYSNLIVNQEG